MQLKSLLSQLKTSNVSGSTDHEITGLCYDSRLAKPGSVFVALKGEKVDGHAFIEQAVDKGAVAVVSETPGHFSRATTITVENARVALADLANAFYRSPSRNLKTIGVTGTNGKTTTTFLLKHICDRVMMRSGLIGTVRYEVGDRILPASRTTPEALDLQELLYQMRSVGLKAAVMEVSSHALVQERVRGIEFDAAIFTNLTQDHLDYHKTMDGYFAAKTLLFSGLPSQKYKKGKGIVNIDDRYGARLVERHGREIPLITYGVGARADFRASNIRVDFRGTNYQLDAQEKSFLVRLPLIGRFNVYNSLAALAAATAVGIDLRSAVLSLANAPYVPGRLEMVPAKRQFQVYVDYAHTDDALVNVMQTLKELKPHRLIVVFGCGGNRDKTKRPKMGAAVEQYADYGIITSDNPRKEDPEAIIADIKKGLRGKNHEVVVDRKEAIFRAISLAQPKDIILIAGKGHETYQEFESQTIPFDDRLVALQALEHKPVEVRE